MVYNGSQLESVEEGEAVAVPGPPPEPRAPEPGAPVPEPGLDLSLSPRSESPGRGRRNCSPGRRKGRADRRGGARKGRQVSWGKLGRQLADDPRLTPSPPGSLLPGPLPPGAAFPGPVRAAAGRRLIEREARGASGLGGAGAAE